MRTRKHGTVPLASLRRFSEPATTRPAVRENPIVALQRQIGNQAVQRLLQRSEADFWEGQPGENQGPPMPQEGGGYVDVNNPNHSYFFESDVQDAEAAAQQEADIWEGQPGENQGPPMPQEDGSMIDVNNPNHSYWDMPSA